ncbi:MAG: hypothetical protein J6A15_10050 [Clostridia bacterium]|nr:hypothetical protein [Clostridia bacterium]
MNEDILEKALKLTRTRKNAIWTYTNRYTSINAARCGYSSIVCYPDGKLTKIAVTLSNYTKLRNLARIEPNCLFIQSRVDIEGTTVEIFETLKIDIENEKVILKKVATYKDGKWDNKEYLNTCKRAITSVKSRAKKYYYLRDVK